MKCSICNKEIEITFLNKILGTVIKNEKGKKFSVCQDCQKKNPTKEEIISKLKG